jgi:hypothetical protein
MQSYNKESVKVRTTETALSSGYDKQGAGESWQDSIDGFDSRMLHVVNVEDNKTIVELRTKLEIRTWFLRASLALNTGVIAGIIARLLA